jgi:hypothetical protein
MAADEDCIDPASEQSLRYWAAQLRASTQELRRAVDQVGPKVCDVRRHLFGAFTDAGPTS